MTYVVTYTLGCFTKHVGSFWVLFGGRILCGIATSLLFSVFESWLVAEHFKRGFSSDWLGNTFSQAVFLGNGLMAIMAGLVGHALVDTLGLGPVSPFDLAALVMVVGGGIIVSTWPENYGGAATTAEEGRSSVETFKQAAALIVRGEAPRRSGRLGRSPLSKCSCGHLS